MKAPGFAGFNPWAYKVKTRFPKFAFKWVNLHRYTAGLSSEETEDMVLEQLRSMAGLYKSNPVDP